MVARMTGLANYCTTGVALHVTVWSGDKITAMYTARPPNQPGQACMWAGARSDVPIGCEHEESKLITIEAELPGYGKFTLLQIWDHDWKLCWRVANGDKQAHDFPNDCPSRTWGDLDFWWDVYDDRLELRYDRRDEGHRTERVIKGWKQALLGWKPEP